MRKPEIKLTTPSGVTEITVGENLSSGLASLDPQPVLLVDEHVLIKHAGLYDRYPTVSIPSGEGHKTLQTVERIYRELVDLEVDRSSLLVGIGGGVATDLAGFVASTYLRQVNFGFISSTLLGQVDASIGGKNGVNLDGYKNMIGTVQQPLFVWCDLSLLPTLERKEYISGIAEVIKYGAIRDGSFIHFLKDRMSDLLELDTGVLKEVVTRCARIKAEVVQQDEKETGVRRILNFGHTIGHAIERDQKVLHGEAIATGMVLAARLSNKLGLLSSSDMELIEELLTRAGLPTRIQIDLQELFRNIRKDKKKYGEHIHFILLEGLGNAVVREFNFSELEKIYKVISQP